MFLEHAISFSIPEACAFLPRTHTYTHSVVFGRRILDASPAHIRRTFDVNLVANFWTVRAFLPAMLRSSKGGHIVTVSSVCAFAGFHSLADYCASKWGSFAFAEALRQEIDAEQMNMQVL